MDRWFSGVSLCSPFSNFRFDPPETGSPFDRDRFAEPLCSCSAHECGSALAKLVTVRSADAWLDEHQPPVDRQQAPLDRPVDRRRPQSGRCWCRATFRPPGRIQVLRFFAAGMKPTDGFSVTLSDNSVMISPTFIANRRVTGRKGEQILARVPAGSHIRRGLRERPNPVLCSQAGLSRVRSLAGATARFPSSGGQAHRDGIA